METISNRDDLRTWVEHNIPGMTVSETCAFTNAVQVRDDRPDWGDDWTAFLADLEWMSILDEVMA